MGGNIAGVIYMRNEFKMLVRRPQVVDRRISKWTLTR
jgi:hypothetical protein